MGREETTEPQSWRQAGAMTGTNNFHFALTDSSGAWGRVRIFLGKYGPGRNLRTKSERDRHCLDPFLLWLV